MYASELFLEAWGWRDNNISLVTHGHPIYPKHGEDRVRTSVSKFSNQTCRSKKTFNRNSFEERMARNPHTHCWLWGNFRKIIAEILQKVKQWWAWEIELLGCYITVRIPPNSLISPGCCILRVCAPAGVYERVGDPAFLTFCFITMSTKIYM